MLTQRALWPGFGTSTQERRSAAGSGSLSAWGVPLWTILARVLFSVAVVIWLRMLEAQYNSLDGGRQWQAV